ncbi:MAG: hypothetical protein AB2A00_32390 [Myxococcota bacterium]
MTSVNPQKTIGKHHLEYLDRGIMLTRYEGDVDEHQMQELMDFIQPLMSTEKTVVYITDMSRMGKFTPEARRLISTNTATPAGQEVHIYMVHATMMTRAAMQLVITAAKLATRSRFQLKSFNSVEEAVTCARAAVRELAPA